MSRCSNSLFVKRIFSNSWRVTNRFKWSDTNIRLKCNMVPILNYKQWSILNTSSPNNETMIECFRLANHLIPIMHHHRLSSSPHPWNTHPLEKPWIWSTMHWTLTHRKTSHTLLKLRQQIHNHLLVPPLLVLLWTNMAPSSFKHSMSWLAHRLHHDTWSSRTINIDISYFECSILGTFMLCLL